MGAPRRVFSIACLALASGAGCRSELKLSPGDELFSILEEAVLEVHVRSQTRRVDVHRAAPERPLRFSFGQKGRAGLETCDAAPNLSDALARLFEIRVRRVTVRALLTWRTNLPAARQHPCAE
jgi:hypothetical protein